MCPDFRYLLSGPAVDRAGTILPISLGLKKKRDHGPIKLGQAAAGSTVSQPAWWIVAGALSSAGRV